MINFTSHLVGEGGFSNLDYRSSFIINFPDELKSEISKTEKQIKASDLKIESLREEKLKSENPVLIKDENDILEITLQSNTVDIKLYKEKIIK